MAIGAYDHLFRSAMLSKLHSELRLHGHPSSWPCIQRERERFPLSEDIVVPTKAGDAPHEGLLKPERREFRC